MAKLNNQRLADFYLPVMQDLHNAMPSAQSAPDLAQLIKDAIDNANGQALAAGFSQDDIDQAKFAIVAWADELIMGYDWPGASAWRLTPLQRYYFSTTRAGTEFYQRLDELADNNTHVREVYALVLIAGFLGEKGTRSHQDLLVYARQLIEKLRQQDNHPGMSSQLFPAAAVNSNMQALGEIKSRPAIITALIICVPLLIVIAVYFYLDFSLSQAVADLIGAK